VNQYRITSVKSQAPGAGGEAAHEHARSMNLRMVIWLLPLLLGYAVETMSAEQSGELRRMPVQWMVALRSAVAESGSRGFRRIFFQPGPIQARCTCLHHRHRQFHR